VTVAAAAASVAGLVGLGAVVAHIRQPSAAGAPAAGDVSLAESSPCTKEGESCLEGQCCLNPMHRCFEKNKFWATCKATCDPGVDPNDEDGLPWSCRMLGIQGMWKYQEDQARKTVANMSLSEKVSMLRGENDGWPADRHGYAGYVGVGRLYADPWMAKGIMPLSMNDGPQGYNSYGKYKGASTQYPSLLTVAASWSTATARAYASAIAEEFVAKGANVLLGPDVEVLRAPLAGRSFETISGEDPFLGSTLVQPFVKAVQDHGIVVCVKHFLDNNQEIYRQSMNVEVDDRAQHEIYLPVFKSAFDSGANAVMCSYNKVYGHYACENDKILTKYLREELKFHGFVLSDWGATHDAMNSMRAGLDIDMQKDDPQVRLPDEYHKLPDLLKSGDITQEDIDKKVVHVLAAMRVSGLFDGRFAVPASWPQDTMGIQRGEQKQLVQADTTSDAHRAVARQTIIDGAVLLKNDNGALPLAEGAKIVMVGSRCNQAEDPKIKQGSVYSGGGSGFVDTDKTITMLAGVQAVNPGVTASIDASGAKGADISVVCAAAHSEEGWDRKDLILPEAKELVTALRQQSPKQKIVVVASVPGAVTTEWVKDADALLVLFEPGEQVGPALADILTGKASPGGRLPISFPKEGEQRFTSKQYPGECPPPNTWCPNMTATFSEGVLVGYRWNDATDHPSAFPFGFGLAYTEFEYSDFDIRCKDGQVFVSVQVKNTGGRDGAAVPQLYVSFGSLKPIVRQLRAFQKVQVPKGEATTVTFELGADDWTFFDNKTNKWASAVERRDTVRVSIGSSSTDLKWHKDLPATCFGDADDAEADEGADEAKPAAKDIKAPKDAEAPEVSAAEASKDKTAPKDAPKDAEKTE